MAEITDVLRVFISSKQVEFNDERRGMAQVIRSLPLLAADFAEDWSPERESIQASFMMRVRKAPIYVGLFGRVYSPATVLEYQTACENPRREILIYIRHCHDREPLLTEFVRRLEDPVSGHTLLHFSAWADLKPLFERHLWDAVRRMIEKYLRLSEPKVRARNTNSVRARRWRETRKQLLDLGLPGAEEAAQATRWATELRDMLARHSAMTRIESDAED